MQAIKSFIKSAQNYNEMSLVDCRAAVDECLDGEHNFTDAECRQFLVGRMLLQLESVASAK